MPNIPAEAVALGCGLAALAWIFFARSQRGRMQSKALIWLSLPFVAMSALYSWFSICNVPIEARGLPARVGILTVSVSQAIILSLLSYLQRGTYGSNK